MAYFSPSFSLYLGKLAPTLLLLSLPACFGRAEVVDGRLMSR